MDNIILVILVTGTLAVVIGVTLKRLDIPPIIGYILSGTIIATMLGRNDGYEHILENIAEFGIVFLMFTIGLEFKMEKLKQMRTQVFLYGGLQVVGSWILFILIAAYLFGLDYKTSIIVGAALSLSSTAIVLKILNDTNEITKTYGQNTLGILLFQDIAVIPILLVLTVMSGGESSIGELILDIVVSALFLFAILIFLGKFVLDKILRIVTKADAHELFIMIVLIIAVGASALAHSFNFTYSLGAFIGGMLIAETHYRHQVEADLIPFRDLFLALFFVTVGMQIDLSFFVSHVTEIFGIGIGVMLCKILVVFLIIYKFSNKRVSLATALAISQVGEFSFVIFAQAQQSALVDDSISQLLQLSIIMSMIATPFLIKKIPSITAFIADRVDEHEHHKAAKNKKLQNHIIMCGYGSFGKQIIKNLKGHGISYLAIVDNHDFFERALKSGENVMFGKSTQKNILLEAGLMHAKAVVIAQHDVETISMIYHTISHIRKDIKIIAKVTKKDVFDEEINTDDFVDIYESTAEIITEKVSKLYS